MTATSRDAIEVVRQHLLATVALSHLPPWPRSGPEWRDRVAEVELSLPDLGLHLCDAPIGWFPIIEFGAREVRKRLEPDTKLWTTQIKEKYGSLRWYASVEFPGFDGHGWHHVHGVISWAETVSARVCAVYGTPDGTLDRGHGWWMTLSPDARQLQRTAPMRLSERLYPAWTRD